LGPSAVLVSTVMTLPPRPDEPRPKRPPYRPPIGIPIREDGKTTGALVSILLHALLLALLLAPPLLVAREINARNEGGGGAGPAGGGGGGTRGTGGDNARERLRFIQIVPTPPAAPKVEPTPIPPPIPKVEPPKPTPQPTPPTLDVRPELASTATSDPSKVAGVGGGSGNDGTAGSGPGSGGGIGSGVGTGRGSGNGPGTGGGDADILPPTVVALTILPIPVPSKVRPYTLVAYFDVDTLGNATLLSFNPSKDGGYNRRIREMLSEIRFRPAVRLDGRPVRDTAQISAIAP
jgi:periplasmic protein TonB